MAFPVGWTRKQTNTISATYIDQDLTAFTVLTSNYNLLSEALDADGAHPALNGGGDLRVSSDSDGATQLPLDVRNFTTHNTPASGVIDLAHKQNVSSLSNTPYTYWWEKSGETQPVASDTYGQYAAYDANYVAVWPMNENPAGTAPQITNRKSASYHGTSAGSMTSGDSVAGAVGNAIDFDGTDDRIDLNNALSAFSFVQNTHVATISALIAVDDLTKRGIFIGDAPSTAEKGFFFMWENITTPFDIQKALRFGTGRGSLGNVVTVSSGANSITDNNFHYVSVRAAAYNNITFQIDGTDKTTQDDSNNPGDSTGDSTRDLYLGNSNYGTTPFYVLPFDGKVDEIRISNVTRAGAWLKAEYYNTLLPTTLTAAGTPETPSAGEETAAVVPVTAAFSVPSVTASYVSALTASVSPVSATFSVPAVTAQSGADASASVIPVSAAFSVTAVTASYISEITASVAPTSASFSVPAVTASYISALTASVAPVSASFSVPAVTAAAANEQTASVAPVSATFSVTTATASFLNEQTANVSPVAASFSVPVVTAQGLTGAVGVVEPVTATFSVPAVTASYVSALTASVSPVSANFSVPAVTAVSVNEHTASVAPVAAAFSVPSITALSVSDYSAVVAPASASFTVPDVTASSVSDHTAGVTPVSANFSAPLTTATYEAIYSVAVSPVTAVFGIPVVTAQGIEGEIGVVDPVTAVFSVLAVTATYETAAPADVAPVVAVFSVPDVTALYVYEETADVDPVDATFSVPDVSATHKLKTDIRVVFQNSCENLCLKVGDEVRLCLEDGFIKPDSCGYIYHSIPAHVICVSCCTKDGTILYGFKYEAELLLPGKKQLKPQDVKKVFCTDNCISDFVRDITGEDINVVGTSIFSQHGCEYPIAYEQQVRDWEWVFGNGSDGDLVVANGETYTLPEARDYFFNNVTIEEGGVFKSYHLENYFDSLGLESLHKIHVNGTLTINGHVNLNGESRDELNAMPLLRWYLVGSGGRVDAGGNGGDAIGGAAAGEGEAPKAFRGSTPDPNEYNIGAFRLGGIGGKGGDSLVPYLGFDPSDWASYQLEFGAPPDPTLDPEITVITQHKLSKFTFNIFDLSALISYSGAFILEDGLPMGGGIGGGGGGGGADAVAEVYGGAGGSGGKLFVCYARNIVVGATGVISANGGVGQDAYYVGVPSDPQGGAGGGGGGGGFTYLTYLSLINNGLIEAIGGLGGAGVDGGGNGLPGTSGQIVMLNLTTGNFEAP